MKEQQIVPALVHQCRPMWPLPHRQPLIDRWLLHGFSDLGVLNRFDENVLWWSKLHDAPPS